MNTRLYKSKKNSWTAFKEVRANTVTLKLISSEMSSATESGELHNISTTFDRQHRARVYY